MKVRRSHSSIRVAAFLACTATLARAEVKTTDDTWHDERRDRDIPVRIYLNDQTTKPAPVILLSHGLGGSREAMGFAANAWAEHGYVVIALQHPGSDESVWKGVPRAQRIEALKDAMNAKEYGNRCLDVHFAIDELSLRDNETGPLKDRVDLDHVGIAGHSFGAQTVQAIIGQRLGLDRPNAKIPSLTDVRVKAAILFSPAFTKGDHATAFADVKVPCFHFTGTKDVTPIRDVPVEQRRVPFDSIKANDQYLLTIDGGDHAVFGGTPGREAPPEYAEWHKLIIDLSTHFWDAELRDDAEAKQWLHDKARDVVGKAGTFETKATTKPTK